MRDPSDASAVLQLAHDLAAALETGDRSRIVGAAVALSDIAAELALRHNADDIDIDEAAGLARIRCSLP
jgi:hypothetical protein